MITETIASTAVNTLRLDALGLSSAQLTTRWADAAVSFDESTLRLSTEGLWHAMASGSLHWRPFGAPELTDVAGNPLGGSAKAVIRLHPQTHLRLARLYARRFEERDDGRSIRPVPWAIAFHEPVMPVDLRTGTDENDPPAKPDNARVGRELRDGSDWTLRRSISFHDARGLIIDPVAVACAWRDLLQIWNALLPQGESASDLTGTAGGTLGQIHGLARGRRVHFVDLHGGPYVAPPAGGLQIGSSGAVRTTGPHEWPDGQTISRVGADPSHLRWGFATHGVLAADPLPVPPLPASSAGSPAPALGRDFFRVAAVDLAKHLVGHRGDGTLDGIPAPDDHTRSEPDPEVRDTESIDLLVEGQAVLGAMQAARTGRTPVVAAPIVATDFDLPLDAVQRWPETPAMPSSAVPEAWDPAEASRIRTEWDAYFIGTTVDVELRLPAGIAPRGAHVRVFPRAFIEGPALAESPSARRGDGAATIVGDGELRLVLRNPLNVPDGRQPTSARLRFDVVVVPRPAGVPSRARLIGGLVAEIASGGSDITPPAPTRSLADVPAGQRGESRAPVFGLPPTAPATGDLARLLQAFSESEPREAPRFPTMARNDAVLAARTAAEPAVWDAVLSNGWIAERSKRAQVRLGNPGNPAGPEERVIGVRANGGRLAYDLGRATLRRTRHLVPRIGDLAGDALGIPAAGTGTFAGAALQTIAPRCENPELSAYPDPAGLPDDWAGLVGAIGSLIPDLAGLARTIPAPPVGERWVAEVKREAMAAKRGRRDAQWALRWQIGHARRLIYVETMLLSASAEGSTGAHGWDLVQAIGDRLAAAPDLRVVLSLPREIPFGPGYEGWAKYFYDARMSAVSALVSRARNRVVVFHPVGFPGRPEIHRGNVVVVDDVWAMVGSSTLSRRGLTFDGGLDLSLLDRRLKDGVSLELRELRRRLMARTLGKSPPRAGETPDPGWVRLAQMSASFELFREVLDHGGEGLIQPLWPGPSEVLAQGRAIADPEGRDFDADVLAGALLSAALSTLGGERV